MPKALISLRCCCRPCRVFTTRVRTRLSVRGPRAGWERSGRGVEWRVRNSEERKEEAGERASTLKEIATQDRLIDYFMSAKSRDEVQSHMPLSQLIELLSW